MTRDPVVYGWAVRRDGQFLGRFYDRPGLDIPAPLTGYRTAVYETRSEARAAARRAREGITWRPARVAVVRVRVSVEAMREEPAS